MLQDVPTMLGRRYRVVERLGRGGMADVYRAEDVVLRRTVAIKIFRGGVEREQHLARFRSEVRTLAALTHPHLVALYDAGGDVAEPWCAMEFVDGGSLADREGALPPAAVARIGEQIAAGLGYVHHRGIVHRDVKPSNVLLDSGGDAFLSDFGIAKLIDGTRMTQSGLMIGTAAFLSPEQVRGRVAGPASDVYALGLVLLEALTGRREYPGTPVESAVARLSRPPEIPAEFGTDWAGLIEEMTAEEPGDRPAPLVVARRLRAIARRLAGLPVVPSGTPDALDTLDSPGAPELSDPVAVVDVTDAVLAALTAPADPAGGVEDVAGATTPRREEPVPVPVDVPAVPVVVRSSPGEPPPDARNLIGWFSPERRRRAGAALAGAAAVAAVAIALPLVDGARQSGSVRIEGAASTADPAGGTTAPGAALGDDSQLRVRKAPVGAAALPEEDRPTRREAEPAPGSDGRAVAGTATSRAPRQARVAAPAPEPSTSSSPSTSPSPSPSPSTPASPSPSPSTPASPTLSPSTSSDLSPSSSPAGGPAASSSVSPGGATGSGLVGGTNLDTGPGSSLRTTTTPSTTQVTPSSIVTTRGAGGG